MVAIANRQGNQDGVESTPIRAVAHGRQAGGGVKTEGLLDERMVGLQRRQTRTAEKFAVAVGDTDGSRTQSAPPAANWQGSCSGPYCHCCR